jgi:hypothetical protein
MKKVIVSIAALLAAGSILAQSDTTKVEDNKVDTIKVGNFIIIKKSKDRSSNDTTDDTHVKISKRKKNRNISTNWGIFDLGFANLRDQTVYGSAEANDYLKAAPGHPAFSDADMKLRANKSSNVNIWIFMQKLNIAKHVLNLKYGLGYEMYNYRYKTNISYADAAKSYVFRDSVAFTKNKLFAGYITVPVMVNVNLTPNKRKGFSFSAGMSAGYLLNSRNKQISGERGKQKIKGDFDLNQWRIAYIAEAGLGPVRLYGSYSTNTLHERGLEQYPYAIGIRFSNW